MMSKIFLTSILLVFGLTFTTGCGADSENKDKKAETASMQNQNDYLNIPFKTIDGKEISLADFKGKVILLVNVASKCGYTPQYKGLEELYRTYKDSGLVIIGFPANNFGQQEPGTDEEILSFCQTTYDVTFPMMSKISVLGEDKHPLYLYLTEKSNFPGKITWNFNKFLLNRNGDVVARFDSKDEPMSDTIVNKIKELL